IRKGARIVLGPVSPARNHSAAVSCRRCPEVRAPGPDRHGEAAVRSISSVMARTTRAAAIPVLRRTAADRRRSSGRSASSASEEGFPGGYNTVWRLLVAIRLVILDCDRTLWEHEDVFTLQPPFTRVDGQTVQDAQGEKVRLAPGARELLDALRRRGILISLCSWNRADLVFAILDLLRSEEHTSELQSRVDLVCRP